MFQRRTQKQLRQRKLSREIFINDNGAIDLASIMVGIIVIGIVGGVIAATVFAVIPWSQDNAAKANLSAVQTSEGVQKVKEGQYYNGAALITNKQLSGDGKNLSVVTDSTGSCYVAVTLSASGAVYWASDVQQKPIKWDGSTNDPCGNIGTIVDGLKNPGTGSSGSTQPDAAFYQTSATTYYSAGISGLINLVVPGSNQPTFTSAPYAGQHLNGSGLGLKSLVSAKQVFSNPDDPGEIYIGNTEVGTFLYGQYTEYIDEDDTSLVQDNVSASSITLTQGLPLSTWADLFKGQGRIVYHDSTWTIPANSNAVTSLDASSYAAGNQTVTWGITHVNSLGDGSIQAMGYGSIDPIKNTSLEWYLKQGNSAYPNSAYLTLPGTDVYYSPTGNASDYTKILSNISASLSYSKTDNTYQDLNIQSAAFTPSVNIPANGGKLKWVVTLPNNDVFTFIGSPSDQT